MKAARDLAGSIGKLVADGALGDGHAVINGEEQIAKMNAAHSSARLVGYYRPIQQRLQRGVGRFLRHTLSQPQIEARVNSV